MNKQFFSYLAVVIIGLSTTLMSCDDKGNDIPAPVIMKLLDTETIINGFHSSKFIYDEQSRIKEIWTFSAEKLHEKIILTYTGKDLDKLEYIYLKDGEIVGVNTRNYIKNGNTISWSAGVTILEGEDEGNQTYKTTITLNNDGFVEKMEEQLLGISAISTFTYSNGNLTRWVYDPIFSSTPNDPGERNYTYGDKRSAYSGCNTPKWFMFLHFYEHASYNNVTGAAYSYEFDSDGFPTKWTWGCDMYEFKYQN